MNEHTEERSGVKTYTITASRQFEVDLTEDQLQWMQEKTEADNPENALKEIAREEEIELIEPGEKLLGVQVTIDRPSDD